MTRSKAEVVLSAAKKKIRRSLIEHSETCGEAVLSVSAIVVSAQEVSGRESHVDNEMIVSI